MFKVLDEVCKPTRGTRFSAAVDLRSREDIVVGAGETKLIPLGVKIDMEHIEDIFDFNADKVINFAKEHYLQLMLRSGLGKKGLILPNGVGVIDLDYKDEIMMIVHNPVVDIDEIGVRFGSENRPEINIKKGDRVGQITLLEHKSYLFGIDTDEVRSGGFGSTGTK